MTLERIFLGWSEPCLVATCRVLLERYRRGPAWDLGGVVLALPGARSVRRLTELLVEQAQAAGLALLPPALVTVGQLPERLYLPALPVADALQELVVRVQVLREAAPAELELLRPPRLEPDALSDLATLAREWAALHAELAAACRDFGAVAGQCRVLELPEDAARWEVFAELQARYEARLAELGLEDVYAARRKALEAGKSETTEHIVLVSAIDLPPMTAALLRQAASSSRGSVTALIFAPETESAAFDDTGGLETEVWGARPIPIPEPALRIVDRPRDQAHAVLDAIEALEGAYAADEITVGLGDDGLGTLLEQTLELAGLPARAARGRPLPLSPPALLLSAAAEFLEDDRADRFAALLRHPDLDAWLREAARDQPLLRPGAEDWLTLLDRYTQERLPVRFPEQWPAFAGEPPEAMPPGAEHALSPAEQRLREEITRLVTLARAVRTLLPPSPRTPRPLPYWSEPLLNLLHRVYGHRRLRRYQEGDGQLLHSLERIIEALRTHQRLEPAVGDALPVTAAEAIRLTLRQLEGEALPAREGDPSIELLGWLELQLDDAPALIVTGFNEGNIPQSASADAFLPDRLRRALGLTDNRRRYARDALLLRTLLESRPRLTLIAGRRGAQGDPLTPSRLLFACDEEEVARRALAFYGEEERPRLLRLLLRPGLHSGFYVPEPVPPDTPIDALSVTAFRSYLTCPYRFYLQHVLRLTTRDDNVLELDASLFGVLGHAALNQFGRGPLRHSEDPDAIYRTLQETLELEVRQRFGHELRPAVEIQLHQLRRRLQAFARWQAERSSQGWRIDRVEQRVERHIQVDGQPFLLHGQIDRIDLHRDGRFQILDYKLSDKASPPDKRHRQRVDGVDTWVELQLPLYRRLAVALGIDPAQCSLGYLCLSRDLGDPILHEAEWSAEELEAAERVADEVIRRVRAGIFWPPTEPPVAFSEVFAGILMERCVDAASWSLGMPAWLSALQDWTGSGRKGG